MNNIIYLIGLIVVMLAILSFFGLLSFPKMISARNKDADPIEPAPRQWFHIAAPLGLATAARLANVSTPLARPGGRCPGLC